VSNLGKTIPIAFSGGSYGTYLEWALTYVSTDQEIDPPFTDSGSSHLFLGNHVENINVWRRYIQGPDYEQFVRLHPKISKNESLVGNLEEILESVDDMILIYPDPGSQLLVINNWISKVRSDWWAREVETSIGADRIYKNWPVAPGTPIDSVPTWIKRELLSYYLMPAWQDQVEWNLPENWQNPRCHVILVSDLITRFEHCIEVIKRRCNLTYLKPVHYLTKFHKQMLELQRYQNQDQLCKDIVNNTLDNTYFDWRDQEVPLASQAWIQWQLRNLGWEIKCNGLDTWPTNSIQLKNLIYQSNNDKFIP
jgi:hypothetical protein